MKNLFDDLSTVSSARIFFGHQSVGKNIISGIEKILTGRRDNYIYIVELIENIGQKDGFFYHSAIGRNKDPVSKCENFNFIIEKLANKIDVAFMKFCYIDFDRNTDVDRVFQVYQQTMDSLISKYPNIAFLHTTVPLRYTHRGFGIWIREALGRPNISKMDNAKRNEFNKRLKLHFHGAPFIDIAEYESTQENGERESFKFNGKAYYSLVKDFTNDGGHLNELGRRVVAHRFIQDLASIIRSDVVR